jgi:hypothetical protein
LNEAEAAHSSAGGRVWDFVLRVDSYGLVMIIESRLGLGAAVGSTPWSGVMNLWLGNLQVAQGSFAIASAAERRR